METEEFKFCKVYLLAWHENNGALLQDAEETSVCIFAVNDNYCIFLFMVPSMADLY